MTVHHEDALTKQIFSQNDLICGVKFTWLYPTSWQEKISNHARFFFLKIINCKVIMKHGKLYYVFALDFLYSCSLSSNHARCFCFRFSISYKL